jgi:hypothetical protein
MTSPLPKLAENRCIAFAITTLLEIATPLLEVKHYLARKISTVINMMFS